MTSCSYDSCDYCGAPVDLMKGRKHVESTEDGRLKVGDDEPITFELNEVHHIRLEYHYAQCARCGLKSKACDTPEEARSEALKEFSSPRQDME